MKVVAKQRTQATVELAVAGAADRRVDDPTASRANRLQRSGTRVEQLLTVAEAAQCVGCCEETIRRAYLARQLDVLRFGARRVRIRASALTTWLERGGKTIAT
jgi:excisionase family DNA binding protein